MLAIDDALRAAVRRQRITKVAQPQAHNPASELRPREIQRRIRAGETAEDIAKSSGVSVDHVRKYEGPVLAERQYIAELARKQSLRGSTLSENSRGKDNRRTKTSKSLDEIVRHRIQGAKVSCEPEWDAWKTEGCWVVQVKSHIDDDELCAEFEFTPGRSHLEPANDDARALLRLVGTDRALIPQRHAGRPESAMPDDIRRSIDIRQPRDETEELLDELQGRRGLRQPMPTLDEFLAEDGVGDISADDIPPSAHPAQSEPWEARDAEILSLPDVAFADAQHSDNDRVIDELDTDAVPLTPSHTLRQGRARTADPNPRQRRTRRTAQESEPPAPRTAKSRDTQSVSEPNGSASSEKKPPKRRNSRGTKSKNGRASVPPVDIFFGGGPSTD